MILITALLAIATAAPAEPKQRGYCDFDAKKLYAWANARPDMSFDMKQDLLQQIDTRVRRCKDAADLDRQRIKRPARHTSSAATS